MPNHALHLTLPRFAVRESGASLSRPVVRVSSAYSRLVRVGELVVMLRKPAIVSFYTLPCLQPHVFYQPFFAFGQWQRVKWASYHLVCVRSAHIFKSVPICFSRGFGHAAQHNTAPERTGVIALGSGVGFNLVIGLHFVPFVSAPVAQLGDATPLRLSRPGCPQHSPVTSCRLSLSPPSVTSWLLSPAESSGLFVRFGLESAVQSFVLFSCFWFVIGVA